MKGINREFKKLKEERIKEQNIRNRFPFADYYSKAKSRSEMCNSQCMKFTIKRNKKEKVNAKALIRIQF